MARRKSHRDVEFFAWVPDGPSSGVVKRFDDAASWAVIYAMAHGKANIDSYVYSRAGARWLAGDDGVEQYDDDPEASVFERIEVKANVLGRIP